MTLHDAVKENLINLPSFVSFINSDGSTVGLAAKVFNEEVVIRQSDKKLIDLKRYAVVSEVGGTSASVGAPILQSLYGVTLYSHVAWRRGDKPEKIRDAVVSLIDTTNNICLEFANSNLKYLSIISVQRPGPISLEESDEVGPEDEVAGLDNETTEGRLVTTIVLQLGAST